MKSININLSEKKKKTSWLKVKIQKLNLKNYCRHMNSMNIGWDSTKRPETPYFHYGPSGQNENEGKG